MSSWTPISEAEIRTLLDTACDRMSVPQRQLWEAIRIAPTKWEQHPYGTLGGGFWVVGLYGHKVIWFNDIEEGFNRSRWSILGTLDEYWCNQDQLEWTIQNVLNEIGEASPPDNCRGAPQKLEGDKST
ncbi:MAG: hypothetical protein RL693_1723 [Verrucomicrobiota bacterium]